MSPSTDAMAAQYYYIDPETQDTLGPASLADLRAMYDAKTLGQHTLICRVVMEEWGPPEAYPELLPQIAAVEPKPGPPTVAAPAPETVERRGRRLISVLAAAACLLLAIAAGTVWWLDRAPRANRAVTASIPAKPTVVPSPTATQAPAAEPVQTPTPVPVAGNVVRGTDIAIRLLDKYPKLKVAVISGMNFPKPDGIELYGTGAHGSSISFLIPQEAWDALSDEEKLDLQSYVAAKVSWVREHAEDYMIIPKEAPVYAKNLDRARHLVDGAWRISNTQTYSDDPDGNLYLKEILVKGPGY